MTDNFSPTFGADSTRFGVFEHSHRTSHQGTTAFSIAVKQLASHEQFLRIVVARYRDISDQSKTLYDAIKPLTTQLGGPFTFSPEQQRSFNEIMRLLPYIHLEQVTFYLIAKLFLDLIARFLEHYFRPKTKDDRDKLRGLSLDSHDRLTKHFTSFADALGLTYSPDFAAKLSALKTRVADFRDYQIAHHKNPRTTYGTKLGAEPTMFPTISNARPGEKPGPEFETPTVLIEAIDSYLDLVLSLLVDNREKSSM